MRSLEFDLCLQPEISDEPSFNAVAFATPRGRNVLVAQNRGNKPTNITLHDAALRMGVRGVQIPPHSIQTFVWAAATSDGQMPKDESTSNEVVDEVGAIVAAATRAVADADAASDDALDAEARRKKRPPVVEERGSRGGLVNVAMEEVALALDPEEV